MSGGASRADPGDEGREPASSHPIILASASPRRSALLQLLGLRFAVRPADVDEAVAAGETPEAHVRRLALEKARAAARGHERGLVIGGDTVVALDGRILGKPRDGAEAVAMLLSLQGRRHEVHSGVAVVDRGGGAEGGDSEAVEVVSVAVTFRTFGRDVAEAYAATGEPLDKAGAYGIQGKGSALVESIEGDYFAVVGLPVRGLLRALDRLGYDYDFTGLTSRG